MNKFILPLERHFPKQMSTQPIKKETNQFHDVLSKVDQLKVSKHAKMRMQERNINVSNEKWDRIESKMNEAKVKGVTDALVVAGDVALVVNTKNNTIVTALHSNEATDKIFTNINGTIII